MTRRSLLVTFVLIAGACAAWSTPDQPKAPTPRSVAAVESARALKRWGADVRSIARRYALWGRVDDLGRWAPTMCMAPPAPRARFSQSEDESTHGKKLYTLFARDRASYMGTTPSAAKAKPSPFGQVVVKEAWVPQKLPEHEPGSRARWGKSGLRPAIHDGVAYGGDRRAGLFVMFQPRQAKASETDAGWVYATLIPDAKAKDGWTLTAAGKIASCMKCHADADGAGGRLFGLPGRPAPKPR